MIFLILSAIALFASAAAAIGCIEVINTCPYPVHVRAEATPNGGFPSTDHYLVPNDQWSQIWTRQNNDAGWSIKMNNIATYAAADNLLQFEYTYNKDNDGKVYYDMSHVDGSFVGDNWDMTASGSDHVPIHKRYLFPNDNSAMQDTTPETTISVYLCRTPNFIQE